MMAYARNLLIVLVICVSSLACSESSRIGSQSVSANNIYAEIHVTNTGGTTTVVEAQLKEGGVASTNYIDIEGNDRLVASIGSTLTEINLSGDLFSNINRLSTQHKVMNRGSAIIHDFFGSTLLGAKGIWYITSFKDASLDGEFTISFLRGLDDGAPKSTLTLPDAFSITQPVAGIGALYSRSMDNIIVNWTPSGTSDTMVLAAVLVCENGTDDTWTQILADDPGSYTITASTFTGLSGNCTVSINVQRSRSGQLDPGYGKGGIITGHQSRTVVINTTD